MYLQINWDLLLGLLHSPLFPTSIHTFGDISYWIYMCLYGSYGTSKEQFAKVAEKNHRHSANNPYAQFQDVYSLDEILSSKEICDPLTVS